MADRFTPDFKRPRGHGDHQTPDSGSPRGTRPRGKYPQDAGGPPDGPPQRIGKPRGHGDAMTPARPSNRQVERKAPRKTTSSNTMSNPLK